MPQQFKRNYARGHPGELVLRVCALGFCLPITFRSISQLVHKVTALRADRAGL